MVQKLSRDSYEDFVRQKRGAAVHFDADWDVGYRPIARRRMGEASDVLGEQVNFGEVDWDREVELVMSLRVITVPTVAYYLDGDLVGVLPGARQNVLGRLERLLRGQQIGRDDGLAAPQPPQFVLLDERPSLLARVRRAITRLSPSA
jgi:hypothetical protein